jgi:thymidylate synthase (FAD)
MARLVVPEAEALLDREIKVLDRGFVRLVDYLGGDARIVQSARVSYGAGTKTVREDRGLISYLMRNEHTSPFEQVTLTFHTKMPIFVARQWVRHRTARLNEISGRYSVMADEFYLPEMAEIRTQSSVNKQGRSEDSVDPDVATQWLETMRADQRAVYEHYQQMIDGGLARELARINLPLSLYTEWYWQIDLHNLFHFIHLRADPHAQYEIRVFAEALAQCARAVAPLAYEAFEEHKLHSIKFSRSECVALGELLEGKQPALDERSMRIFSEKIARLKPKAPEKP